MEKRREELELWRQRTGRTPMKRMSYLLPCAQNPTPSVPKITKSSQSVYNQRSRGIKQTGSKHSRSILRPLNGGARRRGPPQELNSSLQRAAKEQFQRDIDDTVAEILAEEAHHSDQQLETETVQQSDQIAMALDFEGTEDNGHREPCSAQKSSETLFNRKKRRSSAFYIDEELAFNSSKICYTTVYSEQRRKSRRRRSRYSCLEACSVEGDDEEAGRSLLYLTPVRRSTRSRRSLSAHPRVDAGPYFDSPGQAEGTEGYQGVRVIPNHALSTNT